MPVGPFLERCRVHAQVADDVMSSLLHAQTGGGELPPHNLGIREELMPEVVAVLRGPRLRTERADGCVIDESVSYRPLAFNRSRPSVFTALPRPAYRSSPIDHSLSSSISNSSTLGNTRRALSISALRSRFSCFANARWPMLSTASLAMWKLTIRSMYQRASRPVGVASGPSSRAARPQCSASVLVTVQPVSPERCPWPPVGFLYWNGRGRMALTTSLAGRVRNTNLPKSHALLPLLEAVVNGIQAIDARPGDDDEPGRISVRVHRDAQDEFDFGPAGPGRLPMKSIVGFTVEDNGVGFTPENMASFETLDSDYKADIGCRGVGRLLWLKAFDRVSVRSTYEDEGGKLVGCQFKFSVEREVEHDDEVDVATHTGAVVNLDGFNKSFQQHAPERRRRHCARCVRALHLVLPPTSGSAHRDHRGRRRIGVTC